MRKILKIILIAIAVIVVLFILIFGLGLYISYKDYKWHTEIAENMGPVILGTSLFDEKLSSCSPSWGGQSIGESWEIRGIKKDYCIVTIMEPKYPESEEDYEFPITIEYTNYYCELPYDIYSNPKSINWENLLKSESCMTN